tara:strand:- start:56286 stop:56843 length:558 start_codon:yes stop_codon:yes gene_type:complete
MSNIDIENSIQNWCKEIKTSRPMSAESLIAMASKVNKEQKQKKLVGMIRLTCLFLMAFSSLVFTTNLFSFVLQGVLTILCLILVLRYSSFNSKLRDQDKSLDLTSFLDHRKKLTLEGVRFLKFTRLMIYPLLILFLVNNAFVSFNRYGLWGSLLTFFISVLVTRFIYNYLEKAIKSYQEKLNSLS